MRSWRKRFGALIRSALALSLTTIVVAQLWLALPVILSGRMTDLLVWTFLWSMEVSGIGLIFLAPFIPVAVVIVAFLISASLRKAILVGFAFVVGASLLAPIGIFRQHSFNAYYCSLEFDYWTAAGLYAHCTECETFCRVYWSPPNRELGTPNGRPRPSERLEVPHVIPANSGDPSWKVRLRDRPVRLPHPRGMSSVNRMQWPWSLTMLNGMIWALGVAWGFPTMLEMVRRLRLDRPHFRRASEAAEASDGLRRS